MKKLLGVFVVVCALFFLQGNDPTAFFAWRVGNDVLITYPTDTQIHQYISVDKANGRPPGKPHKDAIYLGGVSGIPQGELQKTVTSFEHSSNVYGPPINGKSLVHTVIANWRVAREFIHYVDNHHSVTFGTSANNRANSGTGLLVPITIPGDANRYLAATLINAFTTLNTVTFNGDSLTVRLSPTTGGYDVYYFDMVNPDAATADITFTSAASTAQVGGGQYLYGVDQTSPRTDTDSATGTSTSATYPTMTSATDEVCIGATGIDFTPTMTIDAAWTLDFNVMNAASDVRLVVGHITGAASINRADTLSVSDFWIVAGMCINAEPVSGNKNFGLLGVGQ